ncbi:MAG: hypothetical protein KA876_00310 [Prevotella sp.]|nr:hypothetical protein [Prevotella sp.]
MKQAIIIFLLVLSPLCISAQLENIRSLVRTEFLSQSIDKNADKYFKTITTKGKWTDIDYTDRSRSLWQLERHLDRLIAMSLAYENSKSKNPSDLKKITNGIRFWYDGHYRNDNWWYQKIGIPRRILNIAYILDNDIPSNLYDSISASLHIVDSDDFPARPGGDRSQVLSNHAKVLLWQRDSTGLVNIFQKIESEARIAPIEEIMYDAAGGIEVRNEWMHAGRGVQADMSFHHRGDRVNSTMTYGQELPHEFCYWATLLKNTSFAFNAKHIQFIIDFYLDGVCRHLVKARYIEPSAFNRELSRPWEGEFKADYPELLYQLCNGYRAKELRHILDIQKGLIPYDMSFAYLFWQSDYFVFSRPQWQSAVRMHSERNANMEAAHNSEGISNHFRGDGACMLSAYGQEYHGIQPVFDFRMIPGATTPLVKKLPPMNEVLMRHSETVFAGAVCDSLYGAAAFDFKSQRSDLQARKGYFFFDEGYVCLGSNINCSSSDTIVTTVEQCLKKSEVRHDGRWFFHHGNAYELLSDHKILFNVERKNGTWENCIQGADYATDKASEDVFTLALSHGVKPRNDTYAYAVIPNCNEVREPWYTILQNSDTLQAVSSKDNSLSYIVFYKAGNITTPSGIISVDKPCMLMHHNNQYYVSDPSHRLDQVAITINGHQYFVRFNTWQLAGKTVKLELE